MQYYLHRIHYIYLLTQGGEKCLHEVQRTATKTLIALAEYVRNSKEKLSSAGGLVGEINFYEPLKEFKQ